MRSVCGLLATFAIAGAVSLAVFTSREFEDGKTLVARVQGHFDAGEYGEAIEILDHVLANDLLSEPSQLAKAYAMRGDCWNAVGNTEKAIEDYTDGIRLDTKQSQCYFGRGLAWDKILEFDKAIEDYGKVIELVPKSSHSYCNRGGSRFFMGDYDNALADLNEAIRLDPNDVIALTTRSWVWSMKGQFGKAEEDWARVARLTPDLDAPRKRPRLSEANAGQQTGHFMRGDFTEVIFLPLYPGRVEVVESEGEFATIDVARSNAALRRLLTADRDSGKIAVKVITSNVESYAPPALYAAANAMFELGQEEDAPFWFYLAQLRAGSDAMKCGDVSAHQAVSVLNEQYGPAINEHAFQDWKRLKATVEEVVAWDREHAREYDPRWIALHGMEAFSETSLSFEPEQRWAEIDEQRRIAYLDEFQGMIRLMEKSDQDGDGKLSESERAVFGQEIQRLLIQQSESVERYTKNNGQVFFEGHVLDGADAATFESLTLTYYGKDKSRVYVRGHFIKGADPNTFRVIEGPYSKDESTVYCGNVPMDVADIDAFEVVHWNGGWSTKYDKQMFVFEYGESFESVPVGFPAVVGEAWARDGVSYYYGPARVEGADYESFVVVDDWFARDDKQKYNGAFPTTAWRDRRKLLDLDELEK